MIYAVFQYVVIAAIVGFSLWQVGKKYLPKKASAPAEGGGCSSGGCDTCGACSAAGRLSALVEKELHPAE